MSKKSLGLSLVAIIFVSALGVFALLPNNESAQPQKLKVAASLPPTASLTRQIAGDKLEVVQILPAGASPHTYSLRVSDKAAIDSSQTVFVIGHGIDDWIADAVSDQSRIVTLDKNLQLQEYGAEHDEHEEDHDADHDHEEDADHEHEGDTEHEADADHDHDHEGVDPHYWLSAENAIIMGRTITDELIAIAPDHAQEFEDNYRELMLSLRGLRIESQNRMKQFADPEVITFHGGFNYFADEIGLEIVATVEEFPGREPTAAYLLELGGIIKEKGIKVLFKEPQLSDAVVEPLANDYGADVYTLDPLGGQDGEEYQDMYRYNVDTVVQALTLR